MSTDPNRLPDFEPFKAFDHRLVGSRVLWPLVDKLWEDDWRKNSFLGNEMHISRRGNGSEGLMDVTVSAYTERESDDDFSTENIPIISTVEVTIHQHTTDERRDMIIDAAVADAEEVDPDDEDEITINDFDDLDDVQTRVISSYLLDTDGELQINTGQAVTDIEGHEVWTLESRSHIPRLDPDNPETVVHSVIPSRLHRHDMDLLESGLIVFRAPEALVKALQALKIK